MVKVTTKKVKLSEIKLNPDNPRTITEKDMARLVKSLQEFPEMMKLREIVCDESMQILGGNMRFRALGQIGEKECVAKIVTGLTDEQKRRFVISDNSFFGSWDMDALANSWDGLPLAEWGVGLPEHWGQDFQPGTEDDQGSLDKLEPKIVSCPHCGKEFDLREKK